MMGVGATATNSTKEGSQYNFKAPTFTKIHDSEVEADGELDELRCVNLLP